MVRQNRDTQNIYLAMHYGFGANEHAGLAKCLWQNSRFLECPLDVGLNIPYSFFQPKVVGVTLRKIEDERKESQGAGSRTQCPD